MAYADRHLESTPAFTLNAVTNAVNAVYVWAPMRRAYLHRVGLRQVAGSTISATITILKYAGTVSSSVGTITFPNADKIGQMYYLDKSAAPTEFLAGDALVVSSPTGMGAGATTATAIAVIEFDINEKDMTTAPTNGVLVTS